MRARAGICCMVWKRPTASASTRTSCSAYPCRKRPRCGLLSLRCFASSCSSFLSVPNIAHAAWASDPSLYLTLQCSMLLLNGHAGLLEQSNGTDADYLFHQGLSACATQSYLGVASSPRSQDRTHDSVPRLCVGAGGGVDLGQKSLQCGRKPDCLKLFLCWRRLGTAGFGTRVDRAISLARELAHRVAGDPRFVLVREPSSCNVCFYFLPSSFRPRRAQVAPRHCATT